jgi:hypothetical protein
LTPGQLVDGILSNRFEYSTLFLGPLKKTLKRGIRFHQLLPDELVASVCQETTDTIAELVHITNGCRFFGLQAVFSYVARVMADHPTLSTADRDQIKTLLDPIETFRNNNLLGTLLNDIHHYYYTTTRPTQRAPEAPHNQFIARVMANFHQVVASSPSSVSVPSFCERIPTGCSVYLQQVGRSLCDTIQVFFTTHLAELAVRVRDTNREWSNSTYGRRVLREVDRIQQGVTTNDDGSIRCSYTSPWSRIHLFWTININIPSNRRFTFFPETSFNDNFVNITEKTLLDAINSANFTSDNTKEFFNSYQTTIQESPGQLLYLLFFDNKTDYKKSTAVSFPSHNINNQHPPTAFLQLNPSENIELAMLIQAIETSIDTNEYKDSKALFTTFLKSKILTADQLRRLSRQGHSTLQQRRQVLSSTIVTDGNDCRLLAYNIFRGRLPPNVKKRPVQSARDLFPSLEDFSMDRLADLHVEPGLSVMGSLDPGLGNTAVSTFSDPMTPTVITNVRISQGSLLDANRRLTRKLELEKVTRVSSFSVSSITELESTIKGIDITADATGSLWTPLRQAVEARVISLMEVFLPLSDYYNTNKRKQWRMASFQATIAAKTRAIDRLLNHTGIMDRWQEGMARPMIVVGDGVFGRKDDLHLSFLKQFKKRVSNS